MNDRPWLAVDTSGERASVALGTADHLLAQEVVEGTRRHAAELLPALDRALAVAAVSLEEVAGALLTDGPGSFTGLRIGASVVKALAHVRGWPVHTAPSLLVMAWQAHEACRREGNDEAATVLAVADALRGEVYAGAYRFPQGRAEEVAAPAVLPLAALPGFVPQARVIATGLPLPDHAAAGRWVWGPPMALPLAATLLRLHGLQGGTRRVEAIEEWEPEYGRPAEAQAKWEAAHGRRLPDSAGTTR